MTAPNPFSVFDAFPLIRARQAYSGKTLSDLRQKVQAIDCPEMSKLCIYATGSYARGEASELSDLDVFFIHLDGALSKIATTLLSADLIRICRDCKLPEFSADGEYLTVHKLSSIREELGSPKDDFQNYFTARLLLLLESTHIANADTHEKVTREIIDSYYRDYHDHNADFRPVFLVNDIVRFWKTLCLNYENKRNQPDPAKRGKSYLKNLKLKFSRLTTCYSAIVAIAQRGQGVDQDDLYEILKDPPLIRLAKVADRVKGGADVLTAMLAEYEKFLDRTGQADADKWILEQGTRDDAFARARSYGQLLFKLLMTSVSDNETLRYIVA